MIKQEADYAGFWTPSLSGPPTTVLNPSLLVLKTLLRNYTELSRDFPCGSAGKESAWRRERLPTPVFWTGEFQGIAKSWTRLSGFTHARWLLCTVSLCCTAERISLLYTHTPSFLDFLPTQLRLPWWLRGACSMGDHTGSGRSPGGGNDYALRYSCLGNSMDRGAW